MFDESALTKNQLRKLSTLRKSAEPAITDGAVAKWLQQNEYAKALSDRLWGLNQEGHLLIGRGCYVVRREQGTRSSSPVRTDGLGRKKSQRALNRTHRVLRSSLWEQAH